MAIEKILQLAKKHSFFTPTFSNAKSNIKKMQLGHSGSLFQENIKSEWIHSNVVNRENNIHLYTYSGLDYSKELFQNSYQTTLEVCNKKLPFGIAESYIENIPEEKTTSNGTYFRCLSSNILSSTMFLNSDVAMQYFFYWQRQKKLWWKKISSFPGRFHLGEITVISADVLTVDIFAEFSWGKHLMEQITIAPMEKNIRPLHKDKVELPMMVSNKMSLEEAVMGLFCDAFNEDSLENTEVLKMNRRLTPYKCAFAAKATDALVSNQLAELAFYLNKLVRRAGISTVLLSDCTASPINDQLKRNDEWGIPYTVMLAEDSLKLGIIGLRNRDTTLVEEIHVSDLTDYLLQLFNHLKK